jgi:hypothetical protein
MRWAIRRRGGYRMAAIGVATLLSALSATACSAGSRGSNGGSVSPQVTTEVSEWIFPATVTQADAGVAFGQTLISLRNRKFQACMAGLGFDGAAQRFALAARPLLGGGFPAAPGYTNPGSLSSGLVDLSLIRRTGMLVSIRIGNKLAGSGSGISSAQEAAAMRKSTSCWAEVDRLYAPLQGGTISAMQLLWLNDVTRLQGSATARSAYLSFGQCVTEHGASQTAGESLQAFVEWLRPALNGTTYTGAEPLIPPAPVRQLDAHWSSVFAQCAAPVVAAMQRLLPAVQKAFLQSHYQEVTATDKLVAHILADLERSR